MSKLILQLLKRDYEALNNEGKDEMFLFFFNWTVTCWSYQTLYTLLHFTPTTSSPPKKKHLLHVEYLLIFDFTGA